MIYYEFYFETSHDHPNYYFFEDQERYLWSNDFGLTCEVYMITVQE